ncbi:hypothetical protein Psuf_051110 [Phytohabitans suffuscus]|uniref:Uncharacterized protein n=1 Tax=Phytohabitans suffuscus TaxID=624315 RepID=A0A6F8YPH9_9ACTN|nr:hypothetical protein Psuf_051110 [Phytohabitans suffuscus]
MRQADVLQLRFPATRANRANPAATRPCPSLARHAGADRGMNLPPEGRIRTTIRRNRSPRLYRQGTNRQKASGAEVASGSGVRVCPQWPVRAVASVTALSP